MRLLRHYAKCKIKPSVSPSMLKHCTDKLSPVLTTIFKTSLEICHVPACFKVSTVITHCPDLCCHEVVQAPCAVPPQIPNQPTPGPTPGHAVQAPHAWLHLQVDHRLPVWQEAAPETRETCFWISDHQHRIPSRLHSFSPYPVYQRLHLQSPVRKLLKVVDDATFIGLISGEVSPLTGGGLTMVPCCSQNNLELNALKAVEIVVDFRMSLAPPPSVWLPSQFCGGHHHYPGPKMAA